MSVELYFQVVKNTDTDTNTTIYFVVGLMVEMYYFRVSFYVICQEYLA